MKPEEQMFPVNWEEAEAWQVLANRDKEKGEVPTWAWDCNFKLDFDGPLMSISSRFYPPFKHYGPGWDGKMTVYFMGEKIMEKEFKEDTLDKLKDKVEKFLKHYAGIIKARLKG